MPEGDNSTNIDNFLPFQNVGKEMVALAIYDNYTENGTDRDTGAWLFTEHYTGPLAS